MERSAPLKAEPLPEGEGGRMVPQTGVVYHSEHSSWEPHPFAEGLERRILLSKCENGADVSIFLLRAKPGWPNLDVPEHVHETADDITYLLSGQCTVVTGTEGERQMNAGSFIRIPKGVPLGSIRSARISWRSTSFARQLIESSMLISGGASGRAYRELDRDKHATRIVTE